MLRVRLGKGTVDEITRAINNYYRSNHTENMKECREKRKRVPIPRENSEQENVFAYPTARQPALEFAPHALPLPPKWPAIQTATKMKDTHATFIKNYPKYPAAADRLPAALSLHWKRQEVARHLSSTTG